MTTDTGMTVVGTIAEMIGAETIGAETTGVDINGVESRPAAKPSAIVIGSDTRIVTCDTATRTIAATIVASAKPRLHHSSYIHGTSVASTGAFTVSSCPLNRQLPAKSRRWLPTLAMVQKRFDGSFSTEGNA